MTTHASVTDVINLSYEMNLARDGSVRSEEQVREERLKLGFCTECRGQQLPVQLFLIKSARFNPLWCTKEPMNVDGVSFEGKCLRCHPNLIPKGRKKKGTRTSHRPEHDIIASPALSSTMPRDSTRTDLSRRRLTFVPPHHRPEPVITATVTMVDGASSAISSISSPTTRNPRTALPYGSTPATAPAAGTNRNSLVSSLISAPSALATLSIPSIFDPTTEDMPTRINLANEEPSVSSSESNSSSSRNSGAQSQPVRPRRSVMIEPEPIEEDNLEILFESFQRRNSSRVVRQSSVTNLMPPHAESSPVLAHVIRTPRDNADSHSGEQDPNYNHINNGNGTTENGRLSSSSSSLSRSTLTTNGRNVSRITSSASASLRNIFVPPTCDSGSNERSFLRRDTAPPTNDSFDLSSFAEASNSTQAQSPPPTPKNDDAIIKDLDALIDDISDDYDLAVDVLLTYLKDCPDKVKLQEYCLIMVWNLCSSNPAYVTSFVSTQAPDAVLQIMKMYQDNASVQEQGCAALWGLSANEDSRQIIVRAGALARLIKCLVVHKEDAAVVGAAMGCLRTLSIDSEARESMVVLDAVKHVCASMLAHPTDSKIQRDGCATLSNSAVDLKANLVALATDEEMDTIVSCMANNSTDLSVLSAACFSLKNYTYEEKNVRKLMRAPNIISILHAAAELSIQSGSVIETDLVLQRIENCQKEDIVLEDQVVSSLNESLLMSRFDAEDPFGQVLSVMNEYGWSSKITGTALECLVTLTNEKLLTPSMISNDILVTIVLTMENFFEDASIMRWGCDFLEHISKDKPAFRSAIIKAEGCLTISKGMMAHMENIALHAAATGALRILSQDAAGCSAIQQCGESFVNEGMVACLRNPSVRRNVNDIVKHLTSDHGNNEYRV